MRCLEPRCPEEPVWRGRCKRHNQLADQSRYREWTRKLYHSPFWLGLRKLVLSEEPVCRMCEKALSTVVDHIERPRNEEEFWERGNLQGLCRRCHGIKTAKETLHER